ncbi:unnamed protein product [Linum trigynum]|uniref:FAR1 domain-containing protein n=1 Tax=Linum trigynum TaxID=586398 RepID=A0AAV2GC66_9ROSI
MDENPVDEVSVGSVDAQQLLQIATSSDNATKSRQQLETSISTNSANNEQEEGVTSNRSKSDYTSLGLAFKIIEETKQFYKNYAHDLGFSMRDMGTVKRSTKCQPTKTTRYARYCCSKEGYKTTNKSNPKNKGSIDVKAYPRVVPDTRVGCPAIIKFRYDIKKDEWLLDKWITKHNHDLLPPKFKHVLRSNKGISEMHAMVAKVHADRGVSLRQSYELFTTTSGARLNVPFTPHDLKNYITGTR